MKDLNAQRPSCERMPTPIQMKVRASNAVEAVRNIMRLTWCFLANPKVPLGRYKATGEIMSARNPTKSREHVLARERSRTWLEVEMSAAGVDANAIVEGKEVGRERTIVPILEITISLYKSQHLSFGHIITRVELTAPRTISIATHNTQNDGSRKRSSVVPS